jgi:hypothetical protein
MTAYTDPTVAFTLDIVSGTTDVYDALGGIATRHTVAASPHRASRARNTRAVKTRTRRRLHFPRWLRMSVKDASASTSQTPA